VAKQWQATYYPPACPVIAIKAVKSYLHGTERGTTGLKSVRRRSLIGCIDKVNKQKSDPMRSLFCGLTILRFGLRLSFGLHWLHWHGGDPLGNYGFIIASKTIFRQTIDITSVINYIKEVNKPRSERFLYVFHQIFCNH